MAGMGNMTPLERFEEKVNRTADGCWLWTGRPSGGYGRIRVEGRRVQAHRFAYETWRGPIPEGLILDHVVCDVQLCVNPWHVEPRTQGQNVLRGDSPAAQQARQETCRLGHQFDKVTNRGRRECSACARETRRAHRTRNRDAINTAKRAAYRQKVAA